MKGHELSQAIEQLPALAAGKSNGEVAQLQKHVQRIQSLLEEVDVRTMDNLERARLQQAIEAASASLGQEIEGIRVAVQGMLQRGQAHRAYSQSQKLQETSE